MIFKKTKIICTIGPATGSTEVLVELIKAGMDCARLNFSHGDYTTHGQYIKNIREAAKITYSFISILQDLSGPKIRIGKLITGKIILKEDKEIYITTKPVAGNEEIISTNYQNLLNDLHEGELILIDDGKIRLKVKSIDKNNSVALCTIIKGGLLLERKGMNLPSTKLTLPPLTEKDLQDLEFGIQNNVDMVALSFVRSPEDIKELKNVIKSKKSKVPVIAKIERPEAVKFLDEIIRESDMVMVARGDMGIEISPEEVPIIQKKIIKKCNHNLKPVITATQMLESMISSPIPTRAEASDVANAILDGTDCVMLSGETSTGQYPVQTVDMMSKIILKTEEIKRPAFYKSNRYETGNENSLEAICNATTDIAGKINAKVIVTFTNTGLSPLLLSSFRCQSQIIAVTSDKEILSRCSVIWGVKPVMIINNIDNSKRIDFIKSLLKNNGNIDNGCKVIYIYNQKATENESADSIQILDLNLLS